MKKSGFSYVFIENNKYISTKISVYYNPSKSIFIFEIKGLYLSAVPGRGGAVRSERSA